MFRNLAQVSGPDVVLGVQTFLDRLERLPKPKAEGGLGREGRTALELLARRGLTEEVLTPVKQILGTIATIEPARKPERDPEEDAKAELELWRWYLQWSAIARVAVKERRLLRLLGYLQTSGGTATEPAIDEEPVGDEEPEEPVIDEEEEEPVIGGVSSGASRSCCDRGGVIRRRRRGAGGSGLGRARARSRQLTHPRQAHRTGKARARRRRRHRPIPDCTRRA